MSTFSYANLEKAIKLIGQYKIPEFSRFQMSSSTLDMLAAKLPREVKNDMGTLTSSFMGIVVEPDEWMEKGLIRRVKYVKDPSNNLVPEIVLPIWQLKEEKEKS